LCDRAVCAERAPTVGEGALVHADLLVRQRAEDARVELRGQVLGNDLHSQDSVSV
jgi:hypothetical protein